MPLCFVIMGFGKKKDPYTNSIIDLDAIYNKIIKPSVQNMNCECIRADEIYDSGIIDVSMYALLFKADVVIADITTYNPNAMYELGNRHVMKPKSTIIISSNGTNGVFDINHIRILNYNLSGDDISVKEIEDARSHLEKMLESVLRVQATDSPLYTFFPKCTPPDIPEIDLKNSIEVIKLREDSISSLKIQAEELENNQAYSAASEKWKKLSEKVKDEDYYIQREAYCTYMQDTNNFTYLSQALFLLNNLKDQINPETLGLQGAICKRMYYLDGNIDTLNHAISFYKKGWNLKNDYYTGENYANCIDMKYCKVDDKDEQSWCKIEAAEVRKNVIIIILSSLDDGNKEGAMWKYASLSNCYLALGMKFESNKFEALFLKEKPTVDQKATFMKTKSLINSIY